MQPRVPAKLAQPRHGAPDLRLALIESQKTDEIESSATYTRSVHPFEVLVRHPVIDNADAAVAVAIVEPLESVEQKPVIATINRAVHNDAAIETNRLVHSLRLGEDCAFDRGVWRSGPRREVGRVLVD